MSRARTIANYGDGITADEVDLGQLGGRRNLIINGAMQVAQRGTSFTSPSTGTYTLDRWRIGYSGEEVALNVSQASDGPAGLANSYKITLTTPESSLTTTNQINFVQRFEGQNLQSLKKGTSSAESVTLSFYVKSAVTGVYSIEFYDSNNNRQYVTTYSVSSANTWEYKTITVSGDTTGAFNDDNARSLDITWWVDAGPSYTTGTTTNAWQTYDSDGRAVSTGKAAFMTTTSATWQITGVQLEVGSVATPFEHRSFGEELNLCRRYLIQTEHYGYSTTARLYTSSTGSMTSTNSWVLLNIQLPNEMRATPSIKYSDVAGNTEKLSLWTSTGGGMANNVAPHTDYADKNSFTITEYYSAKMGVIIGGYKAEAEL
jgi:hypothetical protein